MEMENDSESEKPGVYIFGQQLCSKLEHIPIKKRIQLRDSGLYQRTRSSVEEPDRKIESPVFPKSDLPGTPLVAQRSDPNFFLKQQADSLKPLQLNDNRKDMVETKNKKAETHPLFFGIQTQIDLTAENADQTSGIDASSPRTKCELPSVSSVASVDQDDGSGTLSLDAVKNNSSFVEKSTLKPDHASSKDLEAVQSITQDNRILWDLNVEMDAWEKPDIHLNVELSSNPGLQPVTSLEKSEDFRLKGVTVMSKTSTESNRQSTVESIISGGICKSEGKISDSADFELVATGSCPDKACSIAEPSMEIVSINISCNHELASKTDEHVTSIVGKNTSKFFASAPRRDPGSLCAAPNYSVVSTEEQSCDNKDIFIEGEAFVKKIQVSDDEDNSSSKRGTDSEARQFDVTNLSSSDQCEQGVSVEKGLSATPKEIVMAETIKAAPSMHLSEELTEKSPEHVCNGMGNPLLSSIPEGCDASLVQSLCVPAKINQGADVIKLVPRMNKDHWTQIEQDYEDGELRDLDMHCWNENETKIGETECLDYQRSTENIAELDESRTSAAAVGKGEKELESKACKLSETVVKDHLVRMNWGNLGLNGAGCGTLVVINTQLEKKLSGWDQLPKDGYASSEKVQTHGIISRTPRSELQGCSELPTLSEDAEDKETVVERRIRPRAMDESYPAESGLCFDKFSGKKRSTPHMHERYRTDDWDSERRSSVSYHDLYDSHSGSRCMDINSKGCEQRRSRSPYDRNEVYGPRNSYSRYYRGRHGSRAEGSGRNLRGRNGCRGSLADDQSESEFFVRPHFSRRDRSFSPRPTAYFSDTRSRSRTRSPLWVPPYEQLCTRVHCRSPEFSSDDRVNRARLPFCKSNFPPHSEMRYTSPPRNGYRPQNKSRSRWNDEEDFDLRGSRHRSLMRSFRQEEKFDTSCSRGSFKSSEDIRPIGYRGRMREITPDRDRGCVGGKDRRKREGSFEEGHQKRYYKDGRDDFTRRTDAENIATQNFPLEGFLEDGGTRSMRKKESRSHER